MTLTVEIVNNSQLKSPPKFTTRSVLFRKILTVNHPMYLP